MGFDLHLREQPARIKEIDATLWGRHRDDTLTQEQRNALYEERRRLQDEYLCYFRLNISGMGLYCATMDKLGMLEWGGAHPPFPSEADFSIPQVPVVYGGQEYQEHDEDSPEYRAYEEAVEAVLAWTDTDKINGNKFNDNSGWIVTPREIAKSLDVYYALKRDDPERIAWAVGGEKREYWDRWISFLENACEAGGFEVH